MFFPLRRRLSIREKILNALRRVQDGLRHNAKELPSANYCFYPIRHKFSRLRRSARYAAEDTWYGMKKLSRHTEALLFSGIIVLAVVIVVSAGDANLLNSLIALLLLVLIVVIYVQLKFQKRMLDQYVPRIDFVRILGCQLYSDRIRMVNLYGALERLDQIKKIRNVRIRYEIVNDSFSPVSVSSASLAINLKKGKRVLLPATMSILNVEPKRASGTDASFRLPREIDFDSIGWLELGLAGNCKKKIRIRPHLYANIILRGKKPELIFEPFTRLMERREISGSDKG